MIEGGSLAARDLMDSGSVDTGIFNDQFTTGVSFKAVRTQEEKSEDNKAGSHPGDSETLRIGRAHPQCTRTIAFPPFGIPEDGVGGEGTPLPRREHKRELV